LTLNGDSQYEILAIDNGSSDDTVSIAKKLNVKTFIKPSLTVAGLRNFGARMAKNDILIFLDADVVLTDNWSRNSHIIWKVLQENPHAIIGSRCLISTKAGWIEKAWFEPLLYRTMGHMNSGHMIISREFFRALGGFKEELVADEDPDFSSRAKNMGAKIINIPTLEVIHNGYPKNVKDFLKREAWHGKGQYQQGMLKSPTGILTIVFLLLHISFLIFLYLQSMKACILVSFSVLSICYLSSKVKYEGPFRVVLHNTFLYYFYFLARAVSFLTCFFNPDSIRKKRRAYR